MTTNADASPRERPDAQQRYFGELPAGLGLRRQAVRSAGATVLVHSMATLVQMGGTIVLARLLTPRDVGLVTMVTTFSILLQSIGLNGFTEAIIQVEHISHRQVSTLFWVNLGLNLLLAVLFAVAAPLIAGFYKEPELVRITQVMALSVAVGGLATQHLALLKRNMCFGTVSLNDLNAITVSTIAAAVMAWCGWGYWALVARFVLLPVVAGVGAWVACRWWPGAPRYDRDVKAMIKFAAHTYGNFVTNYGGRNVDKLLLGWQAGSGPLGHYKRAYDLFLLPVSQISAPLASVALSSLTRLRTEPARYRRDFLSALSVVAFGGMAISGIVTLAGKDIIRFLMGPQWDLAGGLLACFGPGIGIVLIYAAHGWLHLSLGKADRWFAWGLVELAVTALLFMIGLPYGPWGVALAFVAAYCLLVAPGLWYAGRPVDLRLASIFAATWRCAAAALLASLLCLHMSCDLRSVARHLAAALPIVRMSVVSAVFLVLYLTLVVLLHRGLGPILQVIKIMRHMLPKTRPPEMKLVV